MNFWLKSSPTTHHADSYGPEIRRPCHAERSRIVRRTTLRSRSTPYPARPRLAIIPHPSFTPCRPHKFPHLPSLWAIPHPPSHLLRDSRLSHRFPRLSLTPPPIRRSSLGSNPLGRNRSCRRWRHLTWHNLHNPAYLMGGKTIVGALIFGLISVELIKRYIGLRQSTGDLYAIPLALGIVHRTHRLLPHRTLRQHLRHSHHTPLGHKLR